MGNNILKKISGIFVELPADAAAVDEVAPRAQPVTELIAQTPGPSLEEIKHIKREANLAPGGEVAFADVYASVGLTPVAFSAEDALQVIGSLPAELPLEVKRKTVNATLTAMGRTMGVDTNGVVADASRKIAAVSAFGEQLQHQTQQYVNLTEAQISKLEAEIAELRGRIQSAQASLARATAQCTAETDRLDDVLEFFTLDTGASRHAPG
jgi:hypothetical protein